MVWLHMVDDEVVNRAVANGLLDVFYERYEEIHFHCINKTNLFVVDDI